MWMDFYTKNYSRQSTIRRISQQTRKKSRLQLRVQGITEHVPRHKHSKCQQPDAKKKKTLHNPLEIKKTQAEIKVLETPRKTTPPKTHNWWGNEKQITLLREFLCQEKITKIGLLHGPPGSGKSFACLSLAEEMNYHPVIVNASSERSYQHIYDTLVHALLDAGFGKKKMVILEEIEGAHHHPKNSISAVADFMNRYGNNLTRPILATCNDMWVSVLKKLLKHCEKFEFHTLDVPQSLAFLKHVVGIEDVKRAKRIAQMARGDMRQLNQSTGHCKDQRPTPFEWAKELLNVKKLPPRAHEVFDELNHGCGDYVKSVIFSNYHKTCCFSSLVEASELWSIADTQHDQGMALWSYGAQCYSNTTIQRVDWPNGRHFTPLCPKMINMRYRNKYGGENVLDAHFIKDNLVFKKTRKKSKKKE